MSEVPSHLERVVAAEGGSTTDELLLALVHAVEKQTAVQERIASSLEEIAGSVVKARWHSLLPSTRTGSSPEYRAGRTGT